VCTQDGLDDETFEHHRSGLIANKLEKDPSLSYQTDDYWSQIVCKRYDLFSHASILHLKSIHDTFMELLFW
jgi:hypothetical protein